MDLQDKVPWTGTPGLKHGHLSKTNPAFAAVENQIEAFLGTIWSRPTVEECTTAWTNLPEALFVDSQDLRKKITVEKRHVPVRDGTMIEIQIYKSMGVADRAPLLYVMHGGVFYGFVGLSVTERADGYV